MAGALKTLYGALQQSQYMASNGVAVLFGEEFIRNQTFAWPAIVMVPRAGDASNQPGYIKNLPQDTEMIWGVVEQIDYYCFNRDIDPQAQPIDHADACETLRQWLLCALQDQRAQWDSYGAVAFGGFYKASGERWATDADALVRDGRCLIVTASFEISVPSLPNANTPDATIETVTINSSI